MNVEILWCITVWKLSSNITVQTKDSLHRLGVGHQMITNSDDGSINFQAVLYGRAVSNMSTCISYTAFHLTSNARFSVAFALWNCYIGLNLAKTHGNNETNTLKQSWFQTFAVFWMFSEHGESLKSWILHLYGEETVRHIWLFEKLRIKKTNSSSPLLSSFAAEITTPYLVSYSSTFKKRHSRCVC